MTKRPPKLDQKGQPPRKGFIWHLKGRWDKVMERVSDVRAFKGPPRSIAEVHRLFLGKSDKIPKPFKDFGNE